MKSRNFAELEKSIVNKRIVYLSAFFIPFLCMLIIYALFKVFPFGDNTVLVMDLNGQYADFFMWYRQVLLGDDSIIYSFSKEMGGNTFGLFAYYLSSPFFLLTLFFPQSIMPEGIALITMLKIACSGLTFAIFLVNVYKKCDFMILIFSTAYALMTYSIHYSMCIMWLDGVIWLPIILLGVERVLDGKSSWLFLIAYAMTLISNYYTAYMSTLFTVIFFIYRYAVRDDNKSVKDCVLKVLKLAGTGAVCVLLAVVILYPTLLNIFDGKLSSSSGTIVSEFWNQDIFKIPRRLFGGQYDSITNSGMPNIFCGMLCGMMTGVFFFNPNIKLRHKIAALAVYAVMLASFFIARLDIAWHIFQYPNWYPYRYAYVFCFFSVMTAYCGFIKLDKKNLYWTLVGIGVYFVIIAAVYIADKEALTNIKLARISFLFAVLYAIGVLLITSGKVKLNQNIIYGFLAVITAVEMTANGYVTIEGLNKEHKFKSRSEYSQKAEDLSKAVDFVNERDNGLFRMERTIDRTDNDPMSFGFNGMSHYSSTYNKKIAQFNQDMGMLQEYVLIRYAGSTLITDSLLGVKYIASEKPIHPDYENINTSSDGVNIYENPYALGYAFAADESALKNLSYGASKMQNQDKFAESILGESFTEKQQMSTNGSAASFTASADGTYYMELDQKYEGDISVSINNSSVPYEFDKSTKKIFCLGELKGGDTVNVKLNSSKALNGAEIYRIDSERFEKACVEKRDSEGFNITKHSDRSLEGTITLDSGQVLFTTIPYENGWTAYVDGEKTEVKAAQNTFLAIDAGEGEHEIKLVYHAPGLFASGMVSGVTLTGVILFALRKRIANMIKKQKAS